MARRDRKCICCDSRYKYCPTCAEDQRKPAWMAEFCSEECKDLWTVATKHNMNMLTKQEAKEAISALTLKDHSEYVECVQRDLKAILGEEPKMAPKKVEEEPQKFVAKKKSHEVVKQEENK